MSETYHGEFKEPGHKLVVVDLTVSDAIITDAIVSGDFFIEPDETLFVLTKTLLGLRADLAIGEIQAALDSALPAESVLLGTSTRGIAIAVRRAISNASRWRDLPWEVILTPAISPELNVALDEILTNQVGDGLRNPSMRIWEWNADAIIIGSFQSVKNEVDLDSAAKHGARVIRRISGGGAMYMQSNASISYSLYLPSSFVAGMSFEESYEFLDEWVLEALNLLGVDARYEPLNDIKSPLGKIGGAAQKRLAKGAILHHATLAYDMDGARMAEVLRIGREKISDKGIVSAAKRVDPLKSQTSLTRAEIVRSFAEHFTRRHGATIGELSEADLSAAQELAEQKFLSDSWTNRVP